MKNKQQFEQAVTTASKTLGGNFGVDVQFAGGQAKTDGKTIYIPVLPEDKEVSEKEEELTTGYYCHESSHIRYSEMKYITTQKAKAHQMGEELLAGMMNAVEDCWIEREWLREYEGSHGALSSCHSYVDMGAMMFMDETDDAKNDWRHIGPMAVTWMSGRDKGYTDEHNYRELCVANLGEGMADKVSQWYDELVKPVKNSRQAMDAAREIVKRMLDEQTERQQEEAKDEPMESDAGEQSNDGEQPEGEGQSQGQGQGNQPENCSGDGDEMPGGGSSDPGEDSDAAGASSTDGGEQDQDETHETSQGGQQGGSGEGAVKDDGQVTPYSNDFDLRDALGLDEHDKSMCQHVYRPMTEQYDAVIDWKSLKPSFPETKKVGLAYRNEYSRRSRRMSAHEGYKYMVDNYLLDQKGIARYDYIMNKQRSTLSVMSRKIQRAFLAKTNREWHGGMTEGRLDTRNLVSAYNGYDRVFRRRGEAPEIDTAVQIFVDASSSMHGHLMSMACLTSIMLCNTLDRIGCETEVITFNSLEFVKLWELFDWVGSSFSRSYAQWVIAHKAFDQPMRLAKNALGLMHDTCSGGTPTGDAIYVARDRLFERKTSRKIMIIVTDGYAYQDEILQNAITSTAKRGVEVVGVGIGGNYIGKYCDRSVAVYDPKDLASTVMDDFARLLLRNEKFSASNMKGEAA